MYLREMKFSLINIEYETLMECYRYVMNWEGTDNHSFYLLKGKKEEAVA